MFCNIVDIFSDTPYPTWIKSDCPYNNHYFRVSLIMIVFEINLHSLSMQSLIAFNSITSLKSDYCNIRVFCMFLFFQGKYKSKCCTICSLIWNNTCSSYGSWFLIQIIFDICYSSELEVILWFSIPSCLIHVGYHILLF